MPAGDGRTFRWQAFAMMGAPLAPSLCADFADADERGEFVDLFGDEWLPDDCVAKVDFAAIVAGDAALRARDGRLQPCRVARAAASAVHLPEAGLPAGAGLPGTGDAGAAADAPSAALSRRRIGTCTSDHRASGSMNGPL